MPQDVDGTLHFLDRAENDLSRALGQASPRASGGADADTEAEKEARDEKLDRGESTQLGTGSSAADSCSTACKALSSMRRAVEHLCGLTGEADLRCDTARGRVARAEERVRSSCPSC